MCQVFTPSNFCIVWLFLTGYGLICYQCFSSGGWSECKKTQRVQKCRPYQDSCAKVHAKIKSDRYAKACASSRQCNGTTSFCHKMRFTECQITCCTTNLCNWAQEPMIGVSSFSLRKLLMNEHWIKWILSATLKEATNYTKWVFCFLFFLRSHCSDIVEVKIEARCGMRKILKTRLRYTQF